MEGGAEGGGAEDRRGRMEIHSKKERERIRGWMGKGGQRGAKKAKAIRQKNAEKGVSESMRVCVQCVCMHWRGNNEEGMA